MPAAVPSDFHSSVPLVPSLAEKNRVPPTFVSPPGSELPAPGLMFRTCMVPPAVPLDFHNSVPWVPLLAEKKRVPAMSVSPTGFELLAAPGLMFRIRLAAKCW